MTQLTVTIVHVAVDILEAAKAGVSFFGLPDAVVRSGKIPERRYQYSREFPEGTSVEAVASDAFDFSNNPSREDEWADAFGRTRSLSVGDMVIVDGGGVSSIAVCLPFGWAVAVEEDEKARWSARLREFANNGRRHMLSVDAMNA